jgi:hypothetical protein
VKDEDIADIDGVRRELHNLAVRLELIAEQPRGSWVANIWFVATGITTVLMWVWFLLSIQTYKPIELFTPLDEAVTVNDNIIHLEVEYCRLVDGESFTRLYLHSVDDTVSLNVQELKGNTAIKENCNRDNPQLTMANIPIPNDLPNGKYVIEAISTFPPANIFANNVEITLVSSEFEIDRPL